MHRSPVPRIALGDVERPVAAALHLMDQRDSGPGHAGLGGDRLITRLAAISLRATRASAASLSGLTIMLRQSAAYSSLSWRKVGAAISVCPSDSVEPALLLGCQPGALRERDDLFHGVVLGLCPDLLAGRHLDGQGAETKPEPQRDCHEDHSRRCRASGGAERVGLDHAKIRSAAL